MKKWCAVFFCLILLLGITVLPVSEAAAAAGPKLNVTRISLRPGDTATLSVSGTDETVAWSTKNAKIATVSKTGRVKAVKSGVTQIIATAGGKKLICRVTVMRTYTWTFNGHRYQLIDAGMTWSVARDYCKALGGHLAVITSAREQRSIQKALKARGKKNNYWLGAKKSASGKFRWVTGEAFSYTCFAGGQPDHSNEKCLMIYTYDNPVTGANDAYLWNDLVNAGTYGTEPWFGLSNFGLICEWESL